MKEDKSSLLTDSSTQQENDQKSLFFELFDTYNNQIFRFVLFRVNGNRSLATDLTQDAFTKLWNYMATDKTIAHPEAFLYRIAKNTVIDYFKKSKSYSLEDLLDTGFEPESEALVEELFKNDDIKLVKDLIETLDEKDKQLIFLRYSEEKSIEEIAEIFDKKPNTIAVSIHRILQKLRKNFDKQYGK